MFEKDSKEEYHFVSCRIHVHFKFQNPSVEFRPFIYILSMGAFML